MNIDNSSDPFYRYKRPKTAIGIKRDTTVITNASQICKAVGRDPSQFCKFLGKKASAISVVKKDTVEVKRIMTLETVNEFIQDYIDKYVLCRKCSNPETIIQKTGKKMQQCCGACGANTVLSVDNKFDTVIFNTC